MSWFSGRGPVPWQSFSGSPAFDENQLRADLLQMGVQLDTVYGHKDGPSMEPGTSTQGREHRKEAARLKAEGNETLKRGDLSPALKLYLEGLKSAYLVSDNHEQVSILASNASHVYYLMEDFLNARKYAVHAVMARPQWYKGLFRYFQACQGLGLYEAALMLFPDLVIVASNQISRSECAKLFVDCLLLAPKLTGIPGSGYSFLKDKILPQMRVSVALWSDAIAALSERGEWKIIKVLIFGGGDVGPLVTSYDATGVKLGDLLDRCSTPDWKSWGQQLAMKLLENEASYKSLAASGKPPIHKALDVGIRTGTFELLKVLLMTYVPSADRDCTDEEGNTLLHVVCKNRFSNRKQIADLLVKYKLDPNIRNQSGQTAAEILAKDDPGRKTLMDTLIKGGFRSSSSEPKQNPEQFPGPAGDVIKPSAGQPKAATHHCFECRDSSVSSWTKARVQQWLRDKGLETCTNKFNDIDGPLLAELKVVQGSAPEYFNQALLDLQLPLRDLLQFSSVLREL